jgi:hypothetical protein
MPLDPLQEEVARLALHLAEAGHVALAGGGAMLAHEFINRPTMDLDLFTSDPGEVGPVTDTRCTRRCTSAATPSRSPGARTRSATCR